MPPNFSSSVFESKALHSLVTVRVLGVFGGLGLTTLKAFAGEIVGDNISAKGLRALLSTYEDPGGK